MAAMTATYLMDDNDGDCNFKIRSDHLKLHYDKRSKICDGIQYAAMMDFHQHYYLLLAA